MHACITFWEPIWWIWHDSEKFAFNVSDKQNNYDNPLTLPICWFGRYFGSSTYFHDAMQPFFKEEHCWWFLLRNTFLFQGDLKQKQREKEQLEEEDFGNTTFGHLRTWLWNTMEYPWTSNLAQVRSVLKWNCFVRKWLWNNGGGKKKSKQNHW